MGGFNVEPEFQLDEILYLKTDPEQLPRLLIGYIIYQDHTISYKLTQALIESQHFASEISRDKCII